MRIILLIVFLVLSHPSIYGQKYLGKTCAESIIGLISEGYLPEMAKFKDGAEYIRYEFNNLKVGIVLSNDTCVKYLIACPYNTLTQTMKELNYSYEKLTEYKWVYYTKDFKYFTELNRKENIYYLEIYRQKY